MTSTGRRAVSSRQTAVKAHVSEAPISEALGPKAHIFKTRSSYRPEIDGLRAIAVIAVIVHHFNIALLPSGFLGVDIFFVISGFVVTASLSGQSARASTEQSWKDYLLTFYAKRVKRLIPALVFCVVITSLVGCFFIDVDLTKDSLRTGIASLFGVSNLYILRQKTDYFGQAAELNLFTQTWSLGIEEQFYLFFPVLLGLCGYSRKRRWQGPRNLRLAVLWLSTLSLVGYLYLAFVRPDAAFFLMPARFWEVGAGCLVFLFTSRRPRSAFFQAYCKTYAAAPSGKDISAENLCKNWQAIAAPLSLFILVGAFLLSRELQTFSTLLAVFLTCLLLWSFEEKGLAVSALSSKWLVKIGLLSYSLYLWHWSVIVLSRWTVGISKWTIPIQLLLIVFLAIASNQLIEKPLRYATWSPAKVKTIGYSLLATISSAVWLLALDSPLKGRFYTGNLYPEAFVSSFGLSEAYEPCGNAAIASENFAECAYPHEPPATTTSEVSLDSPKTLYFVGDSHNGSIQSLASRVIEKGDASRIVIVERDGCLFSLSLMRVDTDGQACLDSNQAFLTKVLATGNAGDVVVMTNRHKLYFSQPNSPDDIKKLEKGMFSFSLNGVALSQQQALAQYTKDLATISERLAEKDIALVVKGPLPDWKQRPSQCHPQWFRPQFNLPEDCEIDATLEAKIREPLLLRLRQLEAKLPNLHIYDPFPMFCDSQACHRISKEGVPLFRDADHLNNYGAEYLYEDFVSYLKSQSIIMSK